MNHRQIPGIQTIFFNNNDIQLNGSSSLENANNMNQSKTLLTNNYQSNFQYISMKRLIILLMYLYFTSFTNVLCSTVSPTRNPTRSPTISPTRVPTKVPTGSPTTINTAVYLGNPFTPDTLLTGSTSISSMYNAGYRNIIINPGFYNFSCSSPLLTLTSWQSAIISATDTTFYFYKTGITPIQFITSKNVTVSGLTAVFKTPVHPRNNIRICFEWFIY